MVLSRSPIARRDLAALILAATCWGVGTVISKAALAEVPPFTLLPIQLAASLAILAILMRHQGIPFRTDAVVTPEDVGPVADAVEAQLGG